MNTCATKLFDCEALADDPIADDTKYGSLSRGCFGYYVFLISDICNVLQVSL